MIDLGLSKLALIGAVALIVIGPEKLPRVARTVGTLLGKAQRYVSDVKAEVNRSMELEELRKMKGTVEGAARDVENSIQSTSSGIEREWSAATSELESSFESSSGVMPELIAYPEYKHPGKNWRLKRGSVPAWYKSRQGLRTKAQSGAARVARHRPPGVSGAARRPRQAG
ncbi:Sec-independent protein translocase subunit TatB [Hylemonella gracilis]|uniref:Sec-independent protein translocase protein TatB n=1 Tax=Hylemonella gracilis TaxID=80880 RepID=A0A4P6UMJ7_9BURK|nr:Sec-independent protein translocase protein TatB [Hylemonella gracilis]QBK04761.1 Sec-independent protein translocase subunit TatB [Hylemonella gracilis]